jgi:protein gp37
MRDCPQHIFQLLTKRPKRARIIHRGLYNLENVWLGTSCSNQAEADKNIPILLQIPAAVRFVSLEPLLEPINFTIKNNGMLICRRGISLKDWDTLTGKCGHLQTGRLGDSIR